MLHVHDAADLRKRMNEIIRIPMNNPICTNAPEEYVQLYNDHF